MAASNPQGQMQFWDNGFPFNGVQLGSNDAGEMQFWDNGFPMQYQFPAAAPSGGQISTIEGIAIANIKTVMGIPIANIKTIEGIATQ